MDMKDITDKEIRFNCMLALMQISGHLSDLVEQGAITNYEPLEVEVDDVTRGIQ